MAREGQGSIESVVEVRRSIAIETEGFPMLRVCYAWRGVKMFGHL